MVCLAAERLSPGTSRFLAYALLGDAVVIADSRVAGESKSLLESLGVFLSSPK